MRLQRLVTGGLNTSVSDGMDWYWPKDVPRTGTGENIPWCLHPGSINLVPSLIFEVPEGLETLLCETLIF
jgi:hypothetical protein